MTSAPSSTIWPGWHLIAHDPNVPGATIEAWDGRRLDLPAHIHARPGGASNMEALNRYVLLPGGQPRDGLNLEICSTNVVARTGCSARIPR